jgi:hypothetical protein
MSSFTIFIMARVTRAAFIVSFSASSSINTSGTICHDSPYLSLSQPHWTFFPPAESFFQ